jgi:hypothetical protein
MFDHLTSFNNAVDGIVEGSGTGSAAHIGKGLPQQRLPFAGTRVWTIPALVFPETAPILPPPVIRPGTAWGQDRAGQGLENEAVLIPTTYAGHHNFEPQHCDPATQNLRIVRTVRPVLSRKNHPFTLGRHRASNPLGLRIPFPHSPPPRRGQHEPMLTRPVWEIPRRRCKIRRCVARSGDRVTPAATTSEGTA